MYLVNFTTLATLLLLTTFFGCSIGQTTVSSRTNQNKPTSGWLYSEVGDKKSNDTYYFKITSSADPSLTNGAKKEFSCKFAALESGKAQAPNKLIEEYKSNQPFVKQDLNFAIKEIKTKECRAVGKYDSNSPFSEWSQCECMITVKLDSNHKLNQIAKVNL